MGRRCEVTGKGVMTGNNVSHAHNKTRRRFLPNLQSTTLYSESLGRSIKMRLTPAAVRTIEHNGGLDAWLTKTSSTKLETELRRLKKQVAAKAASA